jgi:transcriptional regulator with PAS, ATPase and Fis domain
LGGEKEVSVNVRFSSYKQELEEEVKKGNFREDLFYRIDVAKVTIPL